MFLPQPQKLEHLPTLKTVIHKVRELGERTNEQLDLIDKVQLAANKLKRKIGGMDMAKRVKELELKENDQRGRLERVRRRFEVIGKGAADCDGYTSNTEEATFIVSFGVHGAGHAAGGDARDAAEAAERSGGVRLHPGSPQRGQTGARALAAGALGAEPAVREGICGAVRVHT